MLPTFYTVTYYLSSYKIYWGFYGNYGWYGLWCFGLVMAGWD
jgi:hypothetical protein